mmetsp:Transcript_18018/g.38497  ORF Transcript_18018/g.38497 Transcript_18018/m.38497 type:complete len:493 (-) Transcript_18018:46-1524(-)
MAHHPFRPVGTGRESLDNDGMVDTLVRHGALQNPRCTAAFRAVDRGYFWVPNAGASAYADMPVRQGKLHQSAPHIYARALEALMPLKPGMSFLNIGSGTGYFSCLVAELVGPDSINDGIDIWQQNIEHSKERVRRLQKYSVEFTQGNVYELDVNLCMRYDRIYIGACACQRAEYLQNLLEIGGVLVAPFETGYTHQELRKIVRVSETRFERQTLNSVHFASLLEPAPSIPPSRRPGEISVVESGARHPITGLPGVPFTFALRYRAWCRERGWAYPKEFQLVAKVVLQGASRVPITSESSTTSTTKGDVVFASIPPEIWEVHILPFCARWWFAEIPTDPSPHPSKMMKNLNRAGAMVKRAFGLSFFSLDSPGSANSSDTEAPEVGSGGSLEAFRSITTSGSSSLTRELESEGSGLLSPTTSHRRERTTSGESGCGPRKAMVIGAIVGSAGQCCQSLSSCLNIFRLCNRPRHPGRQDEHEHTVTTPLVGDVHYL